MPKRKRAGSETLQEKLDLYEKELFRTLKETKGFERQRYSKRLRDRSTTPEKAQRLQREIAVLKSLDLHQAAKAHLYSCLSKVKAISASTDLPDQIRQGLPKPTASPEEQAAIHNVTSGLYKQNKVKQVVEKAVAAVCQILQVPGPEDRTKRQRNGAHVSNESIDHREESKDEDAARGDNDEEEVTDFEGFDSDVDKEVDGTAQMSEDGEDDFSKYNDMFGSSSDSEEVDFTQARFAKLRGTEQVNLDDISVSGSAAESDSAGSESDINTESESERESGSHQQHAVAGGLADKARSRNTKAKKASPVRAGESAFLPSLMGGYISGSESASDVDVAPPKKRLGQKQRQAIAEKKYGAQARHLRQQAENKSGSKRVTKGARDSGWDMRRGAVDGSERSSRTPWRKNGSSGSPFLTRRGEDGGEGRRPVGSSSVNGPPPVERKKDDQGSLHPSWQARKMAKEGERKAEFAGSKIVFD